MMYCVQESGQAWRRQMLRGAHTTLSPLPDPFALAVVVYASWPASSLPYCIEDRAHKQTWRDRRWCFPNHFWKDKRILLDALGAWRVVKAGGDHTQSFCPKQAHHYDQWGSTLMDSNALAYLPRLSIMVFSNTSLGMRFSSSSARREVTASSAPVLKTCKYERTSPDSTS